MNPIPELAPQLKQLRLSGILDSLEARSREAIHGKLAYTDFLAMLIGDEVARRESKKFTLRLRRAQFRTTKTYFPQVARPIWREFRGRLKASETPVAIRPAGRGLESEVR